MSVVDDWSPLDETCQPIRDRLTVIVQWYDDFWAQYFAGAAGEVTRIIVAISELEESVCDGTAGPDTETSVAPPALITLAPVLTAAPCVIPEVPPEVYPARILVSGAEMLDVFSMPFPCALPPSGAPHIPAPALYQPPPSAPPVPARDEVSRAPVPALT